MITLIALHLITSSVTASPVPESCAGRSVDRDAIAALMTIEEELGVPRERRGILAAVWCVESAWTPSAEPLYGDRGRALGPLQFHLPLWRMCGLHDDARIYLLGSARCWLYHVERLLPKAFALCGPKRAFDVAEAMVSAPARYGWRCDARSKHVRLLAAWQKQAPKVVVVDVD